MTWYEQLETVVVGDIALKRLRKYQEFLNTEICKVVKRSSQLRRFLG